MSWTTLLFVPGLLLGITVHEFAHAWAASLLGDRFAQRSGRVSLNPLQHLSPLGTLCMFLLPFGWGRPVPVNLYSYRRPRRDYLLVSLAGPASNLLVVALCAALMPFTRRSFDFTPLSPDVMAVLHLLVMFTALSNLILAAFNLIPIPPLDGSKLWPCLFQKLKPAFTPKIAMFSWILLIVLLTTRALDPAIGATVKGAVRLMPPSDASRYAAHARAANAAIQAGDFAAAERELTHALALNPRSVEYLFARGMVRAAAGNAARAREDLTLAAQYAPDDARIAQALKTLGDPPSSTP